MLAARRITKALSHSNHMQVGHDWGTELAQPAVDLTLAALDLSFHTGYLFERKTAVAMLVKHSLLRAVAESAGDSGNTNLFELMASTLWLLARASHS